MSKLNTVASQEQKIAFLSAACQGDGDATPLYAYADWLEESGSPRAVKRAAQVRRDTKAYSQMTSRTMGGDTWLVWYARHQLCLVAEGLFSKSYLFDYYARVTYRGNYNADGGMANDDRSLEYAMAVRGVTPVCHRSSKTEDRLGRILEALGYGVEWLE